MRADRRNRSRLARLVLGLAFACVVLYLGEVGLRIAGVAPAYRSGESASWRMTPNLRASSLRGPRDGHAFIVTTNADGLRTALPKERAPGVMRVAVMGDSTVFGWGVDDGASIADGLQAALQAPVDGAPPRAVEVLNAGQPGYSTTQAAWLFDEVVAAYTPDRVIVFVTMHDFNKVLISDRELLEGGSTTAARVRILLASNSRMYQLLRQSMWVSTEKVMLLPHEDTGEPRVDRVSDAERARGFDAMRATLATWGGELLIGFLPFHADLVGQGGDRIGVDWAHAYGKAHDVAVIDARACCGSHSGALVLADDFGHLAAEGNLKVGASMAPAVRASLGP
ncbi:MAG: SGNH/GDSL hydrolase family protein [Pseudomonadota bacterium]|nr:SGNH/GDSL hydrolase family protein [Pseudomonadota bacterium]